MTGTTSFSKYAILSLIDFKLSSFLPLSDNLWVDHSSLVSKNGNDVSSAVKLHRIVHHHGLQQYPGRAVHYHIIVFLNSFNKSARPEPDGKKTWQKAAGFHFYFCQEGGKVFLFFRKIS